MTVYRTWILYSLPTVGTMMLLMPSSTILQGVYARDYGLPLTALGAIVLLARVFDAVTDPLIGALSDRYRARHGHRRPWIIGGALLLAVFAYLLYVPLLPGSLWYFATMLCGLYLAWTILEIPHISWGADLSVDSRQRSALYTVRGLAYQLGSLAAYAFPLLPFFAVHEYNPTTLKWFALAGIAYLVPASLFMALRTPIGELQVRNEPLRWRDLKSTFFGNRPLMLFIAIMLLAGLGLGIWIGVLYIALDSYFQLREHTALLFTLTIPAGLVGLPVWGWIAAQLSKRIAWTLSMGLGGVCLLSLALVPPGPASLPILIAIIAFLGAVMSGQGVLVPAILADTTDYAQWKFGREVRAIYFSVYSMSVKILAGLGAGLGLFLLGLFGYDAATHEQTELARIGMLTTLSLLPGGVVLLSATLIWLYPLTEKRHAVIIKRMERLAAAKRSGLSTESAV